MRALVIFVLVSAVGGCGSSTAKPADDYHPPDFSGTVGDAALPAGLDGASAPDAATPSLPGLGSTVVPGGVAFQLWAPDAQQVFVAGEWNQFSDSADALAPDGNGNFSGVIAAASAGQSYQYTLVGPGGTVHKADPRGLQVDGSGRSLIVDGNSYSWSSSFTAPSEDEMVIYELHVGTFNVTGALPSKFSDVISKLDYLQQLGVNMIELMPPAHFSSKTSWGYNPSLPFAIAAAYGTTTDFKELVDAAHAHGIGVIVDVVHNHYSSRTPLMCFEGDCPGIYFYSDARQTTPWGPRPNFGSDGVRSFIVDNALLWLGEYRCDGMRWDSVSNIRQANGADNPDGQSLLKRLNDTVHAHYPHALQIAEDLQTVDSVTNSTANGGYGFDSQWDAAFFHPVDDTLTTANDSDRHMSAIEGALTHAYNGLTNQRVVYTESHDEDANGRTRMPQMISPTVPSDWNARKRSTLGAAVVMTAPGIPMIFMGQEFLEDGSFSDTNPLDWSKTTTFAPILTFYQDLIRLRRNLDGNSAGLTGSHIDVFHVNETAHVLAWRRWQSSGDDVVVLANFSAKTFTRYDLGLPAGGTWHVRLSSDDTRYSSDYTGLGTGDISATATARDGLAYTGSFVLAGYSVVIASQ
jgi:1,4-alpha-glucan branching enzyme